MTTKNNSCVTNSSKDNDNASNLLPGRITPEQGKLSLYSMEQKSGEAASLKPARAGELQHDHIVAVYQLFALGKAQ